VVGHVGETGAPAEDSEPDLHTHHWLIGKQDGPSSAGVCKACGEVRDFTNGFHRSYPSIYRVPRPADAPRQGAAQDG
jgi:hypothetical protein